MRTIIRLVGIALLGAATAVLVSCGSSGAGLIPSADAGPLQNDFEEVGRAAESGNGSCSATESALGKTEQDFLALPTTIDKGLHRRLEEGIKHLRKQALEMCEEPTPTATSTTNSTTTAPPTSTETTSTETTSTPSTTTTTPPSTQTTPTTSSPQNPAGGVEAPEEGAGEGGVGEQGAGGGGAKEGAGDGVSNSGGASAGGAQ